MVRSPSIPDTKPRTYLTVKPRDHVSSLTLPQPIAVWPGSSLHYIQTLRNPRYEDYDIVYWNARNPWACLGMGMTVEEQDPAQDHSPYLAVEHIEPEWLKAVGADPSVLEKAEEKVKDEVEEKMLRKDKKTELELGPISAA